MQEFGVYHDSVLFCECSADSGKENVKQLICLEIDIVYCCKSLCSEYLNLALVIAGRIIFEDSEKSCILCFLRYQKKKSKRLAFPWQLELCLKGEQHCLEFQEGRGSDVIGSSLDRLTLLTYLLETEQVQLLMV